MDFGGTGINKKTAEIHTTPRWIYGRLLLAAINSSKIMGIVWIWAELE